MKRIVFTLLVVIIGLSAYNAGAQFIQGAAIVGMNLTQVDGDEVFGFHKVGLNFGASAIIPFKEKWAVSIETSYSEKGAYRGPLYNDSIALSGEYSLKLNYAEIPVLIHYTDKNLITIGTGFAYGRLFKAEEIEHGGARPPYSDSVAFSDNEFSWIADLRFRLYKRLKFNVRYQYSVASIRSRTFDPDPNTDPWTRKQYNNLLSFRLIYVFNESRENFIKTMPNE